MFSMFAGPNELSLMTRVLDIICEQQEITQCEREVIARRIVLLFGEGVDTEQALLDRLGIPAAPV